MRALSQMMVAVILAPKKRVEESNLVKIFITSRRRPLNQVQAALANAPTFRSPKLSLRAAREPYSNFQPHVSVPSDLRPFPVVLKERRPVEAQNGI